MGALLSSCGGKSRNLAAVVEVSDASASRRMPPAPLTRQRSFHEGLVRVHKPTDSVEDFYVILDCIGRGSFSKVFRIKKKEDQIGGTSRPCNVKKRMGGDSDDDIQTNSNHSESDLNVSRRSRSIVVKKDLFFVLKEINLTQVSPKQIDQLLNEVSLLTTIDHKNVIKIYETFSRNSLDPSHPPQLLQIVMEYCSGGDLSTRFPYSEHQVARIIRQIVSAISYLHDRSIIHRDLKLENIVFENERPDSIVKLIDFGVSLVYTPDEGDGLTERVGTIYSMAPETIKGHYSSQADLWSLGVCTYMLLAKGTQPFDAPTNKEIVHKVLQGDYSMSEPANHWAGISDDAKDFVRSLLVVDPALRATATSAKQDPWIIEHHSQRLLQGDVMDEATKQRVRASILQYASTGDFVKLALNVIAKKSTGQEIEELRALFDEFDQDQTGTLNLEEFKAFFNERNEYSEEYVEQIFHQIEVNKGNNISYTEFLAAVMEMQGRIEEYRLAEAFDQIDVDDSGNISKDDLRLLLGDRVDEKYIDQLIADADCAKDGNISYSAFLQAFREQMRDLVGSVKSISNISAMDSMPDFDGSLSDDKGVFHSVPK